LLDSQFEVAVQNWCAQLQILLIGPNLVSYVKAKHDARILHFNHISDVHEPYPIPVIDGTIADGSDGQGQESAQAGPEGEVQVHDQGMPKCAHPYIT
jgi:hypothetical protein